MNKDGQTKPFQTSVLQRQLYVHLPTKMTERAISDLRFSSIFSKTTHATKTQNMSLENSECGQNNSRRTES